MKRLTGRNYPVFVDNMESVDDLAEFWAAVEPEPKINDRISPTSTAFQ
jgi:hypothetical protein